MVRVTVGLQLGAITLRAEAIRATRMQYVQVTTPTGKRLLMDALEWQFLEPALDVEYRRRAQGLESEQDDPPIALEEPDEAAFAWYVVYGALMVQPDSTADQAAAELAKLRGAGFGRITEGATCRLSEVRDFVLFSAVQRGPLVYLPVAVLFGTIEQLPLDTTPDDEPNALTMFPRYHNVEPLVNVLDRPFVLALKREEKAASAALKAGPSGVDWKSFVQREKAETAAALCD